MATLFITFKRVMRSWSFFTPRQCLILLFCVIEKLLLKKLFDRIADYIALLNTFCGTTQNYANQTLNHNASKIKEFCKVIIFSKEEKYI